MLVNKRGVDGDDVHPDRTYCCEQAGALFAHSNTSMIAG